MLREVAAGGEAELGGHHLQQVALQLQRQAVGQGYAAQMCDWPVRGLASEAGWQGQGPGAEWFRGSDERVRAVQPQPRTRTVPHSVTQISV